MIDINLIKEILMVGISASIISTEAIQKIKEMMNTKKYLNIISFIIAFVVGILFSLSFSDLSIINSLWVGLVTWLGADVIYKSFEDKLFKPFSKMNEVIEVPKANEIKTQD